MDKSTRKKIEKVLARMEAAGDLTPDAVVKSAKDPRSPLHGAFEWNDKVAGHKYRLQQARALIRDVHTTVVVHGRRVVVPTYAHDPARTEQGYKAVAKIKSSRELARDALDAEVQRILGLLERARGMAHALDLDDRLEALLQGAIELRAELHAVDAIDAA